MESPERFGLRSSLQPKTNWEVVVVQLGCNAVVMNYDNSVVATDPLHRSFLS